MAKNIQAADAKKVKFLIAKNVQAVDKKKSNFL